MAKKSASSTRLSFLILFILLVLSLSANLVCLRVIYQGQRVAVVYDGDSFELENGTRVRLMGVDAPEKGRCMAEEAKVYLTSLILGKKVRVKNAIVDDYGRLVANVIVEDWGTWTKYLSWKFRRIFGISEPFPDPMVNRAMAKAGLAKSTSTASPYKEAIAGAAKAAKEQSLGIYSTQCRSTSPPSKCAIKGNIQQEGKVYFPPSCKIYPQVIIDLSFGDTWFCSENDAISSGFVLSKSCR
jgi:micrococcal nuclease